MHKLGPKNPLVYRILITIICVIFAIGIAIFAYIKISKASTLSYDIGERDFNKTYKDIIIKDYDEYQELIEKYDLADDLKSTDFADNYYLASFQEYDSCSETKRKKVGEVAINGNTIDIEFKKYNRCGWCKSHMIIYLIKIDKLEDVQNVKINYTYTDDKQIKCGNAIK